MNSRSKYFHLYLFSVVLLGSVCFFTGFFPPSTSTNHFSSKDELPYVNNNEWDKLFAYRTHFNKTVIMIIDALRYDFVDNNSSDEFFPYLSKQLQSKDSCLLEAKVNSPTVTLPRIKSLLTGTVPSFLDIASNFGKTELKSDTFIKQANKNGFKTVFYGDETWINLLPSEFLRSEGTTSFFVSDYFEVDNNVTRNVEVELLRNDWDIMILHYLGLDHIGHIEGPRSDLVKPKLLEMDNVIRHIYENISHPNSKSLFIICGDHGMKDSGGHGGTSISEILVPVAILNLGCNKKSNKKINQIDLAPLLSVLLGIPIPGDSIGKINHEILSGLNRHHTLYALLYNTLRLTKKIIGYNLDGINLDINNGIENGIKYFKGFLNNQSYSDFLNSVKYFDNIQEILSNKLISLGVTYDLPLMIAGMVLFLQSLAASTLGNFFISVGIIKNISIFTVTSLFLHYILCFLTESNSVTCSGVGLGPIFVSSIYLVIVINFRLIKYSKQNILYFPPVTKFIFIATILHILSLTSSSYIEEEHQFWYFMCVSLFLFILRKDVLGFSSLLLCHRFLRYLNQTGDKWASLPDIGDWLTDYDNISYMILFYTFGLISTYIFLVVITSANKHACSNLFMFVQYLCIISYKITSGSVKLYTLYLQHSNVAIARCFWLFTLFKTVIFLKSITFDNKHSYNNICTMLVEFLLEQTIAVVCLLYKPHNIILIPSLLLYSFFVVKNCKTDIFSLIYLHNWLGTIFYFYQGNSNSLSSIDIAPGYVGLSEYNFFITGFYIALNTYSTSIIAFLLMLRALTKLGKFKDTLAQVFHISTLICSSQIIFYSFIITIQRHHIFIWSVFAPKLLYILCNVILNAALIVISFLIFLFCEFTINKTGLENNY